ncbi:MAG: amidase, partial [Planctomycetaceae bacterium]|nr:amidase [Planctomycetaceae bacterium]
MKEQRSNPDRRRVLHALSGIAIGTSMFQRALADQTARTLTTVTMTPARQDDSLEPTAEMIANAEWVAGIQLTDEQRTTVAAAIRRVVLQCEQIRSASVSYSDIPALRFDPEMGVADRNRILRKPEWLLTDEVARVPSDDSDNSPTPDNPAFASIHQLGRWLREGQTSSVRLTSYFLQRLRDADPKLLTVVNFTEELAQQQALRADQELAEGKDRGPLHGIPWGAKDLIAVPGTPTTWGAPQFREQVLHETATVAAKLEQAGAVLVAKLSLGALAMGDQWYGGQTRNPWNREQGSSGSSAGPGAAVAAGLVPFAIGSETMGSIISPSRRCGVTGLRPTFGRVSRAGCMALSWSMDKIGPMARHVDDCGLVFHAIHGADPADPTSVDRWFEWPVKAELSNVRVGFVTSAPMTPPEERAAEILRKLGVTLIPVQLPSEPSPS